MKKRKTLKIILLSLALLLVLLVVGVWSMFGDKIKAANSVEKIADGLYYMEYEGDYGFADFLAQGGAATNDEMAGYIISFLSNGFYQPKDFEITDGDYGCSAFVVEDSDSEGYLMGRNFDWTDCDAMIVHTKPEDGYESVSTCCLEFIGFGEDWKPEGFANQYMSLAAIYVPVDGMNEKGLCIADLMAGDDEETHQNTDKPDLTITAAIRLILDYAATVDEALELLAQYDMNSVIDSAHHYMIADASGRAVVVEYVNNEMVVTESNILTNHYLAEEKFGIGSRSSQLRFDTLAVLDQDYETGMDIMELRDCMNTVSQGNQPGEENTIWTICYHMDALTMDYYWKEDYEKCYSIMLLGKGEGKVRVSEEN